MKYRLYEKHTKDSMLLNNLKNDIVEIGKYDNINEAKNKIKEEIKFQCSNNEVDENWTCLVNDKNNNIIKKVDFYFIGELVDENILDLTDDEICYSLILEEIRND